jgi:hypothetical protein
VAVSIVRFSAWANGCHVVSFGLLASAMAAWDSVDVCRWLVWCIWVVRTATSVVVTSWPLAGRDVPSVKNSFTGLFLGGTSWVCCHARKHGGCQ